MYPKSDLDMILCFMSDSNHGCMLALMWYGQRIKPYELGENNLNTVLVTDDFEASYNKHKNLGIICMEGIEKRIYYVEDLDGYQIAVVPKKFHPTYFTFRQVSEPEISVCKE